MLSSNMSADEEDAVQRELAAMQAEQVGLLTSDGKELMWCRCLLCPKSLCGYLMYRIHLLLLVRNRKKRRRREGRRDRLWLLELVVCCV